MTISMLQSIYNSISKTKTKPAFDCIFGLKPIYIFMFTFWVVFTQTEWAFNNPSLVCILFMPVFSLMCSRQIVCNVTEMDKHEVPKSYLWFLLFPLNRKAAAMFRKLYCYSFNVNFFGSWCVCFRSLQRFYRNQVTRTGKYSCFDSFLYYFCLVFHLRVWDYRIDLPQLGHLLLDYQKQESPNWNIEN